MLAWLQENWMGVAAALYVILNEIIALAPNLKSNSIIQLIVNLLKSVVPAPQLPPK